MKYKIINFILAVLFCAVFCSSCKEQKPKICFLEWDGSFSLGEYRGRSSDSRDIICIVQYVDRSSPRFVPDIESTNWTCYNPDKNLFGPPSHNIVKVYSDKDIIEQILKRLEQPDLRVHCVIQSEQCLQIISISRTFEQQIITRVPFVLTEKGYAVTPSGKDRMLYKILNSALEEQDAQLRIENEEREAWAKKSDAIYHLYKQARESENVDYKSLFMELQKLDALYGAKDPNELKHVIENQRKGMHLMDKSTGPDQPNSM